MAAPLVSLTSHRMTLILVTTLVAVCDLTLTSVHSSKFWKRSLHEASKDVKRLNLDSLMSAIVRQQFNTTTSFTDKHPATVAGLFPSQAKVEGHHQQVVVTSNVCSWKTLCSGKFEVFQVHINFHGEPNIAALRDGHVVHDLSSLATLLTLNALVEATLKGQLTKPSTSGLVQALEALSTFRSPLFGEKKSALLTYWPGETKGKPENWRTTSENAVKGGGGLLPFVVLEKAVKDCKGKCPQGKATLNQVNGNRLCLPVFKEPLSDFAKRYNLPPDVTSSFANLALGTLLLKGGDAYSSVYEVWKASNANFSSLIQHAAQFAYRPLSSDPSVNVIDSRTYYVMEEFLSQRDTDLLRNDSFVTNWIPQTSADGRLQYGQRTMPVYNTVDFFGVATFLHAVTSIVLHNLTVCDQSLLTLIRSNLDLVEWVVSNGRSDYLDLLMTSHPSVIQFYWMLSRTMFDLENAHIQGKKMFQPLQEFYSRWNTTVRYYVTEAILNAIRDGGLDDEGHSLAYVDDIIGTADVNEKGERQPSGSDRLFTTAAAANSLLAAWTAHGKKHDLFFLPNVPDNVALAIKGLVNFVLFKSLNSKTSLTNVIRTTLHKHCQNLPYWFPSNSITSQNGSNFTGSNPTPEVLFGMRGHLTSDEYQTMLSQPHFGQTVSETMPGLNSTSAVFFFWSSPVYTQAMSLLAAAQTKNLKGKANSMEALMNSFKESTQPDSKGNATEEVNR